MPLAYSINVGTVMSLGAVRDSLYRSKEGCMLSNSHLGSLLDEDKDEYGI